MSSVTSGRVVILLTCIAPHGIERTASVDALKVNSNFIERLISFPCLQTIFLGTYIVLKCSTAVSTSHLIICCLAYEVLRAVDQIYFSSFDTPQTA